MKKRTLTVSLFSLLFGLNCMGTSAFASDIGDGELLTIKMSAANVSSQNASSISELKLVGTGTSERLVVSTYDLTQDVTLRATTGFKVYPETIPAGAEEVEVTVTNISYLARHEGQLILRSGDVRNYVHLIGEGTSLPTKDISASPVYAGGTDEEMEFDGFQPGENGYTIEARVKTDNENTNFYPYAVTEEGTGFKGYVSSTTMGLYNGTSQSEGGKMSNPSNGGTFYNTDGLYHTYRYAVTPDNRVFVYRDGIAIDTLRTADFALQPEWSVENGQPVMNLLKNPDFEGEWNFNPKRNVVTRIEGWTVYPFDQYNSTQQIVAEERSNEVDQNNHVLSVDRYMWNAGWAAAEISQTVDVAPNEVYSFSALAKGGIKSDGTQLGSIRIYDLQNEENQEVIPVTSDSYQTYACNFETQATTKQIRVVFYLERDAWGASISSLNVDDVKLTGVARNVAQAIGFQNEGAEIEYFSFDNTGAYAPAMAALTASADSLTITGTGATTTFTVDASNLQNEITLKATSGFAVSPTTLAPGAQNAEVTVTNLTTLAQNNGQVILRSGDTRCYVQITGFGSELPTKDISASPVYAGGTDEEMEFDGFQPGENGYTIEARVKTDNENTNFYPYAVTEEGSGFKGYVSSTAMGLYNGTSQSEGGKMSNPSNGGTFYNTDGLYHTYRYAVTPDNRVFVYRDGIAIDTLRTADFALQPEWSVENGQPVMNLLKNPDFEGEWNFNPKRNVVTRIEGWTVYPFDQYNSTQQIVAEERSNEVDQNNHVLSVDRYMWNAGWAAAEISQTVDVAPNEVYSFSALAKGGIKSDGTQLGSIRIYDLQNEENQEVIPVTSDSYQTYACNFETQATTKQIRVVFYLERDAWGASISSLNVDDVKLTGVARNVAQAIGFQNEGAEIEYFSFDNTGAYAPAMAALTASADSLTITGTGATTTFTVDASNLQNEITLKATSGFAVSPTTLAPGAQNAEVTVTNLTTLAQNKGQVILRSGDTRCYVQVTGFGSELPTKDISASPVYAGGTDEEMEFDGFQPGENGYTIEARVKTDNENTNFYPYAVTEEGSGFKGYVSSTAMGLYNGTSQSEGGKMSNPSNGGTFYNTDGLYHTYRYAVTPDNRVFVYRDGIAIDTLRTADFALQPEWSVENGQPVMNLLKNPDFEGEWNFNPKRNVVTRIEGWTVYPFDQYNSTQQIVAEERSNEVDQNNHVLSVDRYMWNAGWAAAEISQTVDVAPNEVYSFSALAKGGIKSDGTQLGSIRIYDLQNEENQEVIPVTSDSYQTYACNFETQATTKQIRVVFYLERDAWGASISSLTADDVKLTGVARNVAQAIGFQNEGAEIEYFSFDNTGAYAPAMAALTASADSLTITGTGATTTFTVDASNLQNEITLKATSGFAVSPTTLAPGAQNAEVTVTNLTTLAQNKGQVILRSGDTRCYVQVTGFGSELPTKDISASPVYAGGTDEEMEFDGFQPGENGYTIEARVKTDNENTNFYPYAVTEEGSGFKGYVSSTAMGLYNGTSQSEGGKMSNPSNGGTFYNTDGLYHTYRYAVTPDNRVFVYRDGIAIDTLRTADFALQPEWSVENGQPVMNLLKNPDFEGEWNFNPKRNVVTRIEGWTVYPFDQYNSTQQIVAEERSNEVDQNNHVLSVDRYMWNAGWAAAEISQTVDVAPNEVYSFSALAKGGIKSDGTQLGSIRIYDLQNEENQEVIPVTSDSYQTYACNFETQATTKQIRVVFYLERDAWGASISSLTADDVKLTGVARNVAQAIGFQNEGAEIEYFSFDNTGAYAPSFPSLTIGDFTAIEDIQAEGDGNSLQAYVTDGMLMLKNVKEHASVMIYTTNGNLAAAIPNYMPDTGIALPEQGIYIVLVVDGGKRQTAKVIY
ncbi:MAG: carbohydrate binding domain-containing protein [Bacteroidaceae bacterium]|jgi:hypothetical protein